jgi:hypothetical protein
MNSCGKIKEFPPSLESLLKTIFKNVFQQRYRDVVGHAISTRETMRKTSLEPLLATVKNAYPINSLLDGLRVQFKMYSRLCPWLLTWLDYEENFEDDGEGFDDAGAN